jgi:hypothetical protein
MRWWVLGLVASCGPTIHPSAEAPPARVAAPAPETSPSSASRVPAPPVSPPSSTSAGGMGPDCSADAERACAAQGPYCQLRRSHPCLGRGARCTEREQGTESTGCTCYCQEVDPSGVPALPM